MHIKGDGKDLERSRKMFSQRICDKTLGWKILQALLQKCNERTQTIVFFAMLCIVFLIDSIPLHRVFKSNCWVNSKCPFFFAFQSCEEKIKLESVNFRGEVVGTATVTPVSRGEANTTEVEAWFAWLWLHSPHKAVERNASQKKSLAQAILHFWGPIAVDCLEAD